MEDVTLNWKGTDYKVKAKRVFELICRIEDVLPMGQLSMMLAFPEQLNMSKTAKAYTVALKFAGCRDIDEQEVYENMFTQMTKERVIGALVGLVTIVTPPEHLQDSESSKKKVTKGAHGNSSKKRIKRQSPGDSAPESSGE